MARRFIEFRPTYKIRKRGIKNTRTSTSNCYGAVSLFLRNNVKNFIRTKLDSHRNLMKIIREEKIRELQKRTNTKSNTLNERDIENKAVYIEQVLHSNGFTSMRDSEKHLNIMLIKILGLLLDKRKMTHDSQSNRMLVLRSCVTNDIFLRICEILKRVHDIRLSYTCFNGACNRCPLGTLKGNEKVPRSVQRIFQVELIVTVERSPVDLFRNLPCDTRLRKATEDVEEYMEWKTNQERERIESISK